MKRILIILLICALMVGAAPLRDKSYFITLHYKNGAITRSNVTVGYGYSPDRINQPSSGYKLVLKDQKGQPLYIWFFPIIPKVEAPMAQDGRWAPWIDLDEFDVAQQVPYYTEGGTIEVYNPGGTKIRDLPVNRFNQCNQNGICDGRETAELCLDCKGTQKGPIKKFIDGDKLTPQEAADADLPIDDLLGSSGKKTAPNDLSLGGIAKAADNLKWLALIAIIIVIIYLRRNRQKLKR